LQESSARLRKKSSVYLYFDFDFSGYNMLNMFGSPPTFSFYWLLTFSIIPGVHGTFSLSTNVRYMPKRLELLSSLGKALILGIVKRLRKFSVLQPKQFSNRKKCVFGVYLDADFFEKAARVDRNIFLNRSRKYVLLEIYGYAKTA